MIPSQMLKGTLEGCILEIISHNETYGYEISETLGQCGFNEISEGTIYPLLLRLEKNGFIIAQYRQSPVGPKRKYFSISPEGKAEIDAFYNNWTQLSKAVNTVFKNGGK